MNLTTKTIHGVGWSGISQITRLLFQLGIVAILARLLVPDDFGLLAMVAVFTSFVMIFHDFGLTAALIHRKEITEEHLSSIFWLNILIATFLTILLVAVAPIIAYFYDESRLTPIIMVLATTFFISSFGIIQTVLFTKQLNFKPLAISEISAVVISGIIAVGLAFAGYDIWSLVWQQVISSLVMVVFLWNFSSWKPKILFKWQRVKELLGFGSNLTGFSLVNYFNRNIDDFLIGRFLGAASLGFYSLAYKILLFPLNNISHVIGRVMFSSLSLIQDDKERVRYAYLQATRYIAAITFPLMIALLVLAHQFIMVIFGPQWERSIFLLQIFALIGLIQSIGTTVGWIYQSQGRADIMFRWGVFSVCIIVPAIVLGLRWEVEGVTVAYASATFLLLYPALAIPFKLIDLKFSHFIKQLKSISLSGMGMGGIIFALSLFMKNVLAMSDLIILVSCVLIGVGSYMYLLFVLDKTLYKEVFQLLKKMKA